MYQLLTEPGEKSTIFTIFGSYADQRHSWLILQVNTSDVLGRLQRERGGAWVVFSAPQLLATSSHSKLFLSSSLSFCNSLTGRFNFIGIFICVPSPLDLMLLFALYCKVTQIIQCSSVLIRVYQPSFCQGLTHPNTHSSLHPVNTEHWWRFLGFMLFLNLLNQHQ